MNFHFKLSRNGKSPGGTGFTHEPFSPGCETASFSRSRRSFCCMAFGLCIHSAKAELRTYRPMPEVKGTVVTVFFDDPFGELNDPWDSEQVASI
jgi:hypothetical protein